VIAGVARLLLRSKPAISCCLGFCLPGSGRQGARDSWPPIWATAQLLEVTKTEVWVRAARCGTARLATCG